MCILDRIHTRQGAEGRKSEDRAEYQIMGTNGTRVSHVITDVEIAAAVPPVTALLPFGDIAGGAR
jgi:hypothetical protein